MQKQKYTHGEEIPVGTRFGRWSIAGSRQGRGYPCRCDCGTESLVETFNLRNGRSISCGCHQKERVRAASSTHGGSGTRLYARWLAMKTRCYNSRQRQYSDWGGRGIRVCQEWLAHYEAFRDWAMANGYRDDLTLDRIDNDGDYGPDNCRWVARSVQIHNRRPRSKK